MVVLLILVLFALLVAPRVLTSLYPAKLDTAVSAIQADIDFARARATATGVRHLLTLATETGEIQVVPYRLDGSDQIAGQTTGQTEPERVLRDQFSADVKVTEWSVTPIAAGGTEGGGTLEATDVVTFYPEGLSDSAVLVLEDGSGNRRGLQLNGYTGELRELTAEELPPR